MAEPASSGSVGTRPEEENPQRQPPMKARIAAPKRSRITTPPCASEEKKPKVGSVSGAAKIRATP
ncbi:hypothetical protein BH23PSE1_BH23PSE1_17230 [soil metagenome]